MSTKSVSAFLLCTSLCCLAATATLTPGKVELHTIANTSNGDRYFFTYYPNSLANSTATAAPLAVVLHEMGQSCFDLMTNDAEAHLTQSAESSGVIFVAPCGLKGSTGVSWNAGVCCGWNDNSNAPNDAAFIESIVTIVTGEASVDPRRVTAMGMGNGGFMAQMLGCLNPTKFPLITTIAGMVTFNPGDNAGNQVCSDLLALGGSVRPRLVMLQGDQDGVVGWSSSPVVHLLTPVENFVMWGERNGCITGRTGYPVDQWSNQHFESRVYNSSCLGGGTVELVRWWGGGHKWPTAADNFDATTYFFDCLVAM